MVAQALERERRRERVTRDVEILRNTADYDFEDLRGPGRSPDRSSAITPDRACGDPPLQPMCYDRRMSGSAAQVPIRDLRNHTAQLVRRAEAGESMDVTVNGRPVARLVPLPHRRDSMPARQLFDRLRHVGGGADSRFREELGELLPGTTDDLAF